MEKEEQITEIKAFTPFKGEMGKEEQITDIQAFTKEIGKNEQNETKKENHKISETISMQRGYSEHKDLTIVELGNKALSLRQGRAGTASKSKQAHK